MDYEYFNSMSTEDFNDYIMHYGVKGMKWGVVKERIRSSASRLKDRGIRFFSRKKRMGIFELRTRHKQLGEASAAKHRHFKIRFKKKNDISEDGNSQQAKSKQMTNEEIIAQKKRDILNNTSGDAKAKAVYDNINLFTDQELVGIRNRLALESSVREYRDRVPNYAQAEQQARVNRMRSQKDKLKITSEAVQSGITMWNYGAAAYNAFAKPAEQLPIVNTNFNSNNNKNKNKNKNDNDDDDD